MTLGPDAKGRLPQGKDVLFLTVFGLAFVGLMGFELLSDFEPAKLGGLLVPVMWAPLLVVHEAGHAIMAKLVGWQVSQIVLGYGRARLHLEVAGIPVVVRSIPVEGFVVPIPDSPNWPRLKNCLVYLAGPGAELLVVTALAVVLGPEVLFARSADPWVIAAQSTTVAAIISATLNLIPRSLSGVAGGAVSDGMGALMSPFLTPAHFEARRAAGTRARIEARLAANDPGAALMLCEALMADAPGDRQLRHLAARALATLGRREEAEQYLLPGERLEQVEDT